MDRNSEALGIPGRYLCIKDLDFNISGSYSAPSNSYIAINVIDCEQARLDKISPGKTCKPKNETKDILDLMIL